MIKTYCHSSSKYTFRHPSLLLTWTAPLLRHTCIYYATSSSHFTVCFPPLRSHIAALSPTLQYLRRLAAFGFQARSFCRAAPFIAFVPERACVQRHCVFMLPPLYLKMTHMLKPGVQSRRVFFLFLFCLLSISCVTGSALWQSLRLRALCAPTMSIADGQFNYYACGCVCQPHISSWRGRCLQKPTGLVIFCVLMLAVDRQNPLQEAESLESAPQAERKCRVADDFTKWGENGDTHRGVKIIKAAVVRKTATLIYF